MSNAQFISDLIVMVSNESGDLLMVTTTKDKGMPKLILQVNGRLTSESEENISNLSQHSIEAIQKAWIVKRSSQIDKNLNDFNNRR